MKSNKEDDETNININRSAAYPTAVEAIMADLLSGDIARACGVLGKIVTRVVCPVARSMYRIVESFSSIVTHTLLQ